MILALRMSLIDPEVLSDFTHGYPWWARAAVDDTGPTLESFQVASKSPLSGGETFSDIPEHGVSNVACQTPAKEHSQDQL